MSRATWRLPSAGASTVRTRSRQQRFALVSPRFSKRRLENGDLRRACSLDDRTRGETQKIVEAPVPNARGFDDPHQPARSRIISDNADFRISPRTPDDLIASGGGPSIIYVIVIVIINASVDTAAIPHGQNGNHSWGRANSLLNHNAGGNGAPLVNDASRSGETRNARCDKKKGFHGRSRCY